MSAAKGAVPVQSLTDGYDPAGNITGITDNIASSRSQTLGYDNLNRLNSASGLYGSQSYTYDGVGNRLTRVVGSTTDTYAYSPTANQIATVTTGSNVRSFSYLASGQVSQDVRDASHTYTFAANDDGRNASASLNGSTAGSYLYNAFEQRAQKTASSATIQFVYDRAGHLIEEADGATGAALREYIWLDDLPVAMMDDTGSSPVLYFIHTDQLGTPQKVTDASADVVWEGLIDPFGNAIAITDANWGTGIWNSFLWAPTTPLFNQPLRFPGQYADAETALNQNWFRDYDPTTGRYIQSDPIGLDGGINTYGYVGSSPVTAADPNGKIEALAWCLGGPEGCLAGMVITGATVWAMSPSGQAALKQLGTAMSRVTQNCPDPNSDECKQLNLNVQAAKGRAAALGACRAGMSHWQLAQRYTAWLELAVARAKRDQKCWNGGDPGHQGAQAQAWLNVGNCGSLMQ